MVRQLISGMMALFVVLLLAAPAIAQSAPAQIKPNEEAVRKGLADLVEFEGKNYRTQAISAVVLGLTFTGLGGYLLYDGLDSDSTGETVLGATSITLGVGQLIIGLMDLFETSAIEKTVPVVLNSSDPGAAGYAVLSLSAENGHKRRIRSGITSIATAIGTGLMIIPVVQDESEEGYGGLSDTSWYIILGSTGALSLYNGVVSLIRPSIPEQILDNVNAASGITDSSFEFEVTPIAVKGQDSWMPGLGAVGRF